MTPEASVQVEVAARPMPRLGGGLVWSDITAEIAKDAAAEQVPNPWGPDPEEAA